MKKLILIPILLLVYNGLFGQGDKARFFRAVDIISCEFAYQSIKDQKDSPFLADYQASFPNCGEDLAGAFYSELTTFLTEKDLTATLKLCNTINNYKNRYETEFATKDASDYQAVNTVLTKIFNQGSIQSFKSRHRSTYNGLISRIGNEVLQLYGESDEVVMVDEEDAREPSSPQPQPKPIVPQPPPKENPKPIVDNTVDEFDANDFTPLPRRDRITDNDFQPIRTSKPFIGKKELFWLFAMMIFGLFGFYFVKNAVPQRYDGPLIAEEETMSLLNTLKKEMSKLQAHNDSLEEEVTRLKFRIKQFQEKNIIFDPPNLSKKSIEAHLAEDMDFPPMPPEEEIPLPPPVKTLISTTFFMPLPGSNGTFQGSLAENDFRRAESVYRFEITNEEGTMAVFTVHDDIATMIRALDDPDRYLKPACRSNSIPHISATKILTDKKGLAIKEGNDWRVQRKAIIRYA